MMKERQRKEALKKRLKLTSDEVAMHSKMICEQLIPYLKRGVGIYCAFGNEVCVNSLQQVSGIRFAIPKTYGKGIMSFHEFTAYTQLEKSAFGILEPIDSPQLIDLNVIIVPLVAFDEGCHRIGYGGGYYDRYLRTYKGLKIGIAHECQKADEIKPDEFDVALDMIITEKQIYKRRK